MGAELIEAEGGDNTVLDEPAILVHVTLGEAIAHHGDGELGVSAGSADDVLRLIVKRRAVIDPLPLGAVPPPFVQVGERVVQAADEQLLVQHRCARGRDHATASRVAVTVGSAAWMVSRACRRARKG